MRKTIITLFALIATTLISAQPGGFGGGFGGPGMGMGATTVIDVTPVTDTQMTIMTGNLGLDDKQAKKIRKIAQSENEKVANVVIAARGNMGMGGMQRAPQGGPQGQMQRGERPQDGPQARPEGGRQRRNVMEMFDESSLRELDKIYAQSDKKIAAVLTPQQLAKWQEQASMNVAERESRISQIMAIVSGRGGNGPRGGFGGSGWGPAVPR